MTFFEFLTWFVPIYIAVGVWTLIFFLLDIRWGLFKFAFQRGRTYEAFVQDENMSKEWHYKELMSVWGLVVFIWPVTWFLLYIALGAWVVYNIHQFFSTRPSLFPLDKVLRKIAGV